MSQYQTEHGSGTAPTTQQNTSQLTRAAAAAVGVAMQDDCYALVGGAACSMLGSSRITLDVDFVVPRGQTKQARQRLQDHPAFQVDSRTNHTYYVQKDFEPVEIQILTPPGLFRDHFSASTPYVLVNNVRVLKPTLLLNAKCGSILNRVNETKKQTDSEDIKFLYSYLTENAIPIGSDIPNATSEFIQWFVRNYGGEEYLK